MAGAARGAPSGRVDGPADLVPGAPFTGGEPARGLAGGRLAIAVLVPAGCGALAWVAATALRAAGPLPYLLGTAALLKTTFAVRELGAPWPARGRPCKPVTSSGHATACGIW